MQIRLNHLDSIQLSRRASRKNVVWVSSVGHFLHHFRSNARYPLQYGTLKAPKFHSKQIFRFFTQICTSSFTSSSASPSGSSSSLWSRIASISRAMAILMSSGLVISFFWFLSQLAGLFYSIRFRGRSRFVGRGSTRRRSRSRSVSAKIDFTRIEMF